MSQLISVNFEVGGKVQGVYFRKYTQRKANELGVSGWCMNTERGTVTGQLQGPERKVEEMKIWLAVEGSPKCRIDKTKFTYHQCIDKLSFKQFTIRR